MFKVRLQQSPTALLRGNSYLLLRARPRTIFTAAQFAPLLSHCEQPAERPWQLVLAALLQFAENLSGRRATDAVRNCIAS
jgi:hypothetical protein